MSNCLQFGHSVGQCHVKTNQSSVQRVQVATITCNHCKKPGHIIANCRKREYKDKQRNNSGNQSSPTVPRATVAAVETSMTAPQSILFCFLKQYLSTYNSKRTCLIKKLTFLTDTCAQISLIKENCLSEYIPINKKLDQTLQPKGSCDGVIYINNEKFQHNFTAVAKVFYLNANVEGILGRDFFSKYKAEINYKNNEIILPTDKNKYNVPFISSPSIKENSDIVEQNIQNFDSHSVQCRAEQIQKKLFGFANLQIKESETVQRIC